MKNSLPVIVLLLASTLVESKEVKKLNKLKEDPMIIRDVPEKKIPIESRIVGGQTAGYDDFPYQARLTLIGANVDIVGFCGGSIIGPTWVLTAASCLTRPNDPSYVIAGVLVEAGGNQVGQFRQSVVVPLTEFHIAPGYDSYNYNDVALLRTPVPWNPSDPFVKPIKLPQSSYNLDQYNGKTATASGYGATSNTATDMPSNLLRFIDLTVIPKAECDQQYSGYRLSTSTFCAQDPRPNKGSTCSYDIGGPLALTENGQTFVIGVISFTHPDRGCDGTAQGFQMVATLYNWISSMTRIQ